MKLKLTVLGLLVALALAVAGAAEAAPRVQFRSNNLVVLQGIALNDVETSTSPYGGSVVRLAVADFPLDGPVLVICDVTKACDRVRRGDRLQVRGALRIDLADGRAYVVASSLSLREASK